MPPEKGKLGSGKQSAGKCTTLAARRQRQAAEPTPAPSSAPVQPDGDGVLTYKRKKGDSNSSKSNQEAKRLKIGPFAALQDDEYDELQRVQNHLREVISSIVEPKYVNGTCQDNFWLSVSNCCDDPYGLQLVHRLGNKDGNESLQNGTSEAGDGYHSKTISIGTDNKLKEILSGRDTAVRPGQYNIPLDTVSGKLEGVLYDILTSGKFGLLCDIICQSFLAAKNDQPVKMDFIVAFSSILSKVRKGSYDQSPEVFEQDIQAIVKKFIIIGREMSALAYGLAALTKHHCQKLIDGMSVGSPAEKSSRGESIYEKATSSFQANNQQIDGMGVGSAAEKSCRGESISEKATSSFQANNQLTGDLEGGHSDKCDTSGGIHKNAISSSFQSNNQQIGGFGCGLAEGKSDLDENNCDLEFTNPLLRFLTRQLDDLGCLSTADNCIVGEKIVENASSLHPVNQQMGCLVCNLAAERSKVGEKKIDKTMGSFDKNNQKGTNKCAAKEIDVNSRAAVMVNSCAAVMNSYESVPKSDQTGPSWHYKRDTCKRCGTEADGNKSLICDGCEAMYHISCTEPVTHESPVRSWYCTQCSGKNDTREIDVSNDQHDCLHEGCVVCERLKASECPDDRHRNIENFATVDVDGKREHSLICDESDDTDNESPEPSRTAVLHLCKHCGTREEEDKKFLVCSHRSCHFKYYHIRCLNAAQLACKHQPEGLWYCPSCLCRACLTDKDDHLVCLCDRCDEAYHTYCMDPPRKAIPEGIWCCTSCNKERIKEGVRRFEENILAMQITRNEVTKKSKQHSSEKDVKIENEEYCECTESNSRGDKKLSQPQLAKEFNTEQLKKQLEQGSPSSRHKTVQHRQLKQNVAKEVDTGQLKNRLQQGSPSSRCKNVQHRQLKQSDVKQRQINGDINHQPEKTSVKEQLINSNKKDKQKRSSLKRDGMKRCMQQGSHLNGEVTLIDKQKGYPEDRSFKKQYGRNDVEGQYTNSDITEEQPAEKQVKLLPCRQLRSRSPNTTQPQINGDLNDWCERGVKVPQRNGSKDQTKEMDVGHTLGSIGVLLDALYVSEKMDEEAHESAAYAKKQR